MFIIFFISIILLANSSVGCSICLGWLEAYLLHIWQKMRHVSILSVCARYLNWFWLLNQFCLQMQNLGFLWNQKLIFCSSKNLAQLWCTSLSFTITKPDIFTHFLCTSLPYNLYSACCIDLSHVFSRCIVRYLVRLEYIHTSHVQIHSFHCSVWH